ncbi:paired small multidrug resistance pump [Paenibacillus sp. UNCCL117]|uniref:DMT family transporter n=1 Tax=unclassified Paenibacillus TaxID=185978 RepID=UPI00088A49BD|nr:MULTISPECIES: multidrug efflux SMR transporter [unclassified Paenibacillus]SDE37304.1 paired small multidrug resistance pump [Paenibacillus sp. cl123]SFW64919.1 paired small multidrug resistance pump [Paenibacillus sp. UNCCL117]
MNWVLLVCAGFCEISGVAMMNKLNQDRKLSSLLLLAASFGASFLLLTLAMKTLPMGTAYAIWTGIGASGGAILGMVRYGEPRSLLRILFITMILGSAVGLKLVS